ncbi:hypothetical protein [Halobacillus litoralis]|uniref:hypothetical protein n=1 Tax=Halobacillus litoralis TaxID=45668 RepID=UPI001CD81966|nr:hypothetical protein [Halobacillus litoralis]MCA1021558.1 hypothetical protein [Halobacillus litoralis]
MFYIGIFLLIWLVVGFLTGIKEAWVDGFDDVDEEYVREHYLEQNPEASRFDQDFTVGWTMWILEHKGRYIAVMTLFGFIPLIITIKEKIFK